MIDEPNVDLDLDEVDMKEEQAEIELNDKEAPFLQGKTTKSHVSLAPVLISKNPDGSLQRAAMSQVQRAKDRKDIRDQKQGRNQMGGAAPEKSSTEAGATKDMVQVIRNMYKGHNPQTQAEPKGSGVFDMQPFDANQNFRSARHFKSSQAMQEQRESLPIYALREELREAIIDNRILVVIGETGSGKTTQMP